MRFWLQQYSLHTLEVTSLELTSKGSHATIRLMLRASLVLLLLAPGIAAVCGCSGKSSPASLCYPSNRPGVECEPYPVLTQDELPDCQALLTSDNVACAAKLFAPLDGPPWPFDSKLVAAAVTQLHGGTTTYVAPDWQITAEHILPATCQFPAAYEYAIDGVPFELGAGCSSFLMAGGNPQHADCVKNNLTQCWDVVELADISDICLLDAPTPSPSFLQLSPAAPQLGEQVFVVGYPQFNWSAEQRLQYRTPLVSTGKVVAVLGLNVILSAPAYHGDSGGAVLNAQGQIVGVLSQLVGDVRRRGVATVPAELPDYYSGGTLIDDLTREIIRANSGDVSLPDAGG